MDFSLSIGIESYYSMSPTPCCIADARAFHQIMRDIFQIGHAICLDHLVTQYTLKKTFREISEKLHEGDRFFFFFAGHGRNIQQEPHIAVLDTNEDDRDSFIKIADLLKMINETGCSKTLFFVDACEATSAMGQKRANIPYGHFKLDHLRQQLAKGSASVIFSSTSHKEEADIMPDRTHGIWSHFLMRALSGKESEALNEGIFLTDNSLQNFLNCAVQNFCRQTTSVNMQTPFRWGKTEGEFLIHEFPPANVVAYTEIPQPRIRDVIFSTQVQTRTKSLSGFKKNHRVPINPRASSAQSFIKNIATGEIEEHMETVASRLIAFFSFLPDDYDYGTEVGFGYFNCAFFEYEYRVETTDDPYYVLFVAQLRPIDADVLVSASGDIDNCFIDWFDQLDYSLNQKIDLRMLVREFIAAPPAIRADYELSHDPGCTMVTLTHRTTRRTIEILPRQLSIRFQTMETMKGLFDSLPEISNHLHLVSPSLLLLQ